MRLPLSLPCRTSQTRWGGQMSRAFISHAGRIGNLKLPCSNLDPAGSNPGQVKSMTLKIALCRFLAWCSALLGSGKDWLAQCQDNATAWDCRSWCQRVPERQHYTFAMSAHCHKLVPVPSPGSSYNCDAQLHISLNH